MQWQDDCNNISIRWTNPLNRQPGDTPLDRGNWEEVRFLVCSRKLECPQNPQTKFMYNWQAALVKGECLSTIPTRLTVGVV